MDENAGAAAGTRPSPGYGFGPPWLFRGSALYQLHLVKAENARAFIPKELKLVEAFGYTLGGFFLADYDDSPAGKFDELVVIPGIVWNPPTSCAWAARVLVNSPEACKHGQKEIGLPSCVAMFSKKLVGHTEKPEAKDNHLLHMIGIGSSFHGSREHIEIQESEVNDKAGATLCNIILPYSESMSNKKWAGPKIKMSLPSFSGKTKHNANLLKYSCQIECRVQSVKPAKILGPSQDGGGARNHNNLKYESYDLNDVNDLSVDTDAWDRCIRVLLSKPILALKFNYLRMQVQAPSIVISQSKDNDPKIRAA